MYVCMYTQTSSFPLFDAGLVGEKANVALSIINIVLILIIVVIAAPTLQCSQSSQQNQPLEGC